MLIAFDDGDKGLIGMLIGWVGLIYAGHLFFFSLLFPFSPFLRRLQFVRRYFLFSWSISWAYY